MRVAVLLVNLGGPEEPGQVWRYLYNLFNDPAIFRLPPGIRQIAAFFLASLRAPQTKRLYSLVGGASAVRSRTEEQAAAIEQWLRNALTAKSFTAMRYSAPSIREAAAAIKKWSPDKIVFLPMYPQFSSVTTGSSWRELKECLDVDVPVAPIWSFADNTGFVIALARLTAGAYEDAKKYGAPRVIFSAHGLPERVIRAGDPYPWQCARTAAALARALGIAGLDWVLCYQSRMGPLRWIGPGTAEEVEAAARQNKPIIIVPISFVAENLETQIEIGKNYKNKALAIGAPYFAYVPPPGTAPEFIEELAALVLKATEETPRQRKFYG
jgi:ferrochelatase